MDEFKVSLGKEDAAQLEQTLLRQGVGFRRRRSRAMTGEQLAVTVLLPITLTAVQVVVAFLLARAKNPKPPRVEIIVRKRVIFAKDFSVVEVEQIIGAPLPRDD